MKRRIFVAIPISQNLQNGIFAWSKRRQMPPARWLAGKNLHITLVPPWYEEDVEGIKSILGELHGRSKPFEMKFETVRYGPNPASPRLIWAEGRTPRGVVELKNELKKLLGFKPENRPFLLHLTLARFRPEDFASFPVKRLDEKVDWRETAKSFVLMESHLSRTGADYEALQEYTI